MTHGRPRKPYMCATTYSSFWFFFFYLFRFFYTFQVVLRGSPPRDIFKRFILVKRGEGAILDRRQGRSEYCSNTHYIHTFLYTHIYIYIFILLENNFIGQNDAYYGTAASACVAYSMTFKASLYQILYIV
jgi:hypothetical protein